MKNILLLSILLALALPKLSAQELSEAGKIIYDEAMSMLDNAKSTNDIVDAFNKLEEIVSLPQDSENPDIYYKLGSVASVIALQQSDSKMFGRAKYYYEVYARLRPQSRDAIDKVISELNTLEVKTITAWLENQVIPISEAQEKIKSPDGNLDVIMRQYSTIYNAPEIYKDVKWKFTCSNIGYGFAGVGFLIAGCGLIGVLVSDFESDFAAYTLMTGAGLVAVGFPLIMIGEIGKKSACRKSLMRHNDIVSKQLQNYRKENGITVALGISGIGHPGLIFTF